FYWLGVGNKEQDCIYQWHNPKFKADKNSILVGTNVLCQSVINYMDKLKIKFKIEHSGDKVYEGVLV
ncbi:hypothetical protein BM529_21115, partial [Clostridioides difficile]